MTTMAQHLELINKSTRQSNYNTGQTIDPYRNRLDKKQQEFAKMKKIGYNSSNFIAEQTAPQSNTYGRLT